MARNEALHFYCLIFFLVLDFCKLLHGGAIVGGLEDTAKQHWAISDLCARAFFDTRNQAVTKIGIRAPEIIVEFNVETDITVPPAAIPCDRGCFYSTMFASI